MPQGATYLVVSSGGNDALHASILIEQASYVLGMIAEAQHEFRLDYPRLLEACRKTSKRTVVCTIYDSIPHYEGP